MQYCFGMGDRPLESGAVAGDSTPAEKRHPYEIAALAHGLAVLRAFNGHRPELFIEGRRGRGWGQSA
jgi:hypothetical protein